MSEILTLGEAADALGAQTWRLRRLHDRGLIELPKVGRNVVVPRERLDEVGEALNRAGYLKRSASAGSAAVS